MKDSENNYINTNKIPGYNELVESMETVAQESTSQDILTAVENIDIDTSDLAKEATLGTPAAGQPSTIFAAIAAVGGGSDDAKQTIVDAINAMGGSATTSMTWAQLAQAITQIPNMFADAKMANTTPSPMYLGDMLVSGIMKYIEECTIYSQTLPQNMFSSLNNNPSKGTTYSIPIKKVYAPNADTIPENLLRSVPIRVFSLPKWTGGAPVNFLWQCPGDFIDFITGAYISQDVNLGPYYSSGTANARSQSSSTLVEPGETFANNWEKWNYCLREHFAANLQDRTGTLPFTITFGSEALADMQQATIDAFTNKNWTLA